MHFLCQTTKVLIYFPFLPFIIIPQFIIHSGIRSKISLYGSMKIHSIKDLYNHKQFAMEVKRIQIICNIKAYTNEIYQITFNQVFIRFLKSNLIKYHSKGYQQINPIHHIVHHQLISQEIISCQIINFIIIFRIISEEIILQEILQIVQSFSRTMK